MKTGIFVTLCIALVASCFSVRADDNPDQAAALAALKQKMYELDHSAAPLPPDTNSVAAVVQPAKSTINPTGTLATNAVALQTASADAAFAQKIPADNTSAQAAALAAMEQKMQELNHTEARPQLGTNSVAASVATTPVAAPANEAAAATTPVTETPTAEAPVATSPEIIPSVVTPVSAAPAVVAPAPQTSTAPAAAASMAIVPIATPGPVAVPARTQPAAVPATPKLPSSSPGRMRPTNELVTTTGVIYKNVEVQRVVADGIVISYTPANGDWAMTKVYFRDLPAEIRRQYEKQ